MYPNYEENNLLNRAFPKDSYLLPSIDQLVDNSADYQLLSFMEAYFGYNHIAMCEQRMMSKIFLEEIGETLEVYMDDMIVKFSAYAFLDQHFDRVFKKCLTIEHEA